MAIPQLKSLRVNRLDFESKQVIGKGHFGEVELVVEKHTKNTFAMKVLKKDNILNQRDVIESIILLSGQLKYYDKISIIYFFRLLFLSTKEILWHHQARLF